MWKVHKKGRQKIDLKKNKVAQEYMSERKRGGERTSKKEKREIKSRNKRRE